MRTEKLIFSVTVNANTSHVMKQIIRRILTACSAIALYTHWAKNAAENSSIQRAA